MEVFEAYKGMYEYEELPAYARFLLNNNLKDYATEQIRLSRILHLPILSSLAQRYKEEEIFEMALNTSREYLEYIAANKGKDQIMESMNRWMKNQLQIMGQTDISAKDITLISYLRGQSLKKFLLEYTRNVDLVIRLTAEIDLLLLGSSTTSTDIFIDTLRDKIAEQSKLASKLIEASPAITFLFDTVTNRQIFVSGKVFEVMGYMPEELMQMDLNYLLQLIHPRDIENMITHRENLLHVNNNETKQVEFRFRHKDGNYRWLRAYEVIFSRNGRGYPEYILGKTFEITREKETAIALLKRERELLEAQRLAHIGNYEWNIRNQRSSNSEEVYRIFEVDNTQNFEEFILHVHPDDVQKVRDALAQSFITGRFECEYRYNKNNKEKVIWSLGKVEFRNEEPYKMTGTVQDVTEIKRMEKQLIQKSAELVQSNESLRQFAFVASHDMKEPLRKIMVFSDLVINSENNNLSEKSIGYLRKMQSAGKNLYRMVEDILSFSLLEAREERENADLANVISHVIETLEENISEKHASVIYDDLPPAFIIVSQFRQLFQNLISNSLKFSRKDVKPLITISGKLVTYPSLYVPVKSKKYLELKISDNGIGFPPEMNEKIFELFSRLHSKAEFEGTGLGLSITRRIVENHNGKIAASSSPGKGSMFTIVIPQ